METTAFPVSTDHLKSAQQTPQASLSYLLLQLVEQLPHTDKLLHLRLVVLPPEPLVRLPVHPLGLLRKRLYHVRASSEVLPDGLRLVKSPGHCVIPLALVDEVVAMTAQ